MESSVLSPGKDFRIQIADLSGRIVAAENRVAIDNRLSTAAQLPQGIYLVQVIDNEKQATLLQSRCIL